MEEKRPCPEKCPDCGSEMKRADSGVCICDNPDCGAIFVPKNCEGVIVVGSFIGIHPKKKPTS